VAVPAVVGLAAAEAESRLRAAGFGITRQEATNPAPAGQVVQQNPAGGTQRPRGESVVIVVSRGQSGTPIPNVVGLPQAQAIAALQSAGLRVNTTVNRQGRDQVPDAIRTQVCVGCVLSTSPGAGVLADGTTLINLAVRAD
jgi:serine/threonine-protein kinase